MQKKREIKTDITISLGTIDSMKKETSEALKNHHDILKVKVGDKKYYHDDILRIKAVREVAPKAVILVDANQAWNEYETLQIIDAIKHLNISLIEQPVIAHDIQALKNITLQSPIPILADEAVFTLEDAKNIIMIEAAHMINIKLMKCGGISKAIEILELCRYHDIKCMMGSMLESPHSIYAAEVLSMLYHDVIIYNDLDSPLLYK